MTIITVLMLVISFGSCFYIIVSGTRRTKRIREANLKFDQTIEQLIKNGEIQEELSPQEAKQADKDFENLRKKLLREAQRRRH